jgi:hypothetical protein
MKYPFLFIFIFIFIYSTEAQELPQTVKKILDKQFPHWQFRPNYIPNPCKQYLSDTSSFQTLYECNFNGDDIPDYTVAIITGKGSALIEYFVALVSDSLTYKIYTLLKLSVNHGAGEYSLDVCEAGRPTALFGGENELIGYAKEVPNSDQITFPTDYIIISPDCEASSKECAVEGYVYFKNRFVSFSAGD